MPWSAGPGGGFTRPEATPWLPLGDTAALNVDDQQRDPGSTLHLCRRLVALRRELPDLRTGAYATIPTGEGLWAWRRGSGTAVALNLSASPGEVEGLDGRLLISTAGDREGEAVPGGLRLAPWEGAVVEVS
jgi:glycosidase